MREGHDDVLPREDLRFSIFFVFVRRVEKCVEEVFQDVFDFVECLYSYADVYVLGGHVCLEVYFTGQDFFGFDVFGARLVFCVDYYMPDPLFGCEERQLFSSRGHRREFISVLIPIWCIIM